MGFPILRDFEPFHRADVVFLESTYGDRDHRPFRETVGKFVRMAGEAVGRTGKILVPTFAVGALLHIRPPAVSDSSEIEVSLEPV